MRLPVNRSDLALIGKTREDETVTDIESLTEIGGAVKHTHSDYLSLLSFFCLLGGLLVLAVFARRVKLVKLKQLFIAEKSLSGKIAE